MLLYEKKSNKLKAIEAKPFKLEKEIQIIFESNLTTICGLELVKTEFTIKNKRIDTLAYDSEASSFVIIEYKRDKNFSVIDQGFAYLGLMLENKAEFIVEYNEGKQLHLKRNEIDWSQSKVLFVSTGFTDNQIQAANFKDIAIELWEIKRFTNDLILVNQIKKTQSAESVKPITQRNERLRIVSNEIEVPTELTHLQGKSDTIKELYEKIKSATLNLNDGIEIKPKKQEIGYLINGQIFADICIQYNSIKIWINLKKGELADPLGITRDVSNTGHWGNGDYEIKVSDTKNIEYIMSLVKQSINTR